MTTPNEELRARLLAKARRMEAQADGEDAGVDLVAMELANLLREAAAALARQEEGREAVRTMYAPADKLAEAFAHPSVRVGAVMAYTHRDEAMKRTEPVQVIATTDVESAVLAGVMRGFGGQPVDLDLTEAITREVVSSLSAPTPPSPVVAQGDADTEAAVRFYRLNPTAAVQDLKRRLSAPPSAGEGDAEVARLRQALQDVADPIGYLRREAEAKGERLGGMAYSIANDLHFVKQIASRALATPTPQAGVEGVDTDAIESAWIAECGAGWGLGWEEMLRKMFKPGTWGEEYKDGEVIYTHPNHGTELTAYMASKILATHGPFVQGYRAALTAKPATAGQQAAGVSDAVVERAMRAAAAEHERTPSPIPAGYEPIRRQVRAALEAVWPTAAGAAPEGWVPVPREPTLAMENAWQQHYGNTFKGRYRAMLAAAPQPGAQHGQEGRE